MTLSLARRCSTTEPLPPAPNSPSKDLFSLTVHFHCNGGEGETRTLTDYRPHDPKSCSSTNSDTSPGDRKFGSRRHREENAGTRAPKSLIPSDEIIGSRFPQGQDFGRRSRDHSLPRGGRRRDAYSGAHHNRTHVGLEVMPVSRNLSAESPGDFVPIDYVEPGAHVVRPLVLIFEIVGVLPNVNTEDWVAGNRPSADCPDWACW